MATTRLGLAGIARSPYGSFAGKTEAAPTGFVVTGSLSLYFNGSTYFSIPLILRQ